MGKRGNGEGSVYQDGGRWVAAFRDEALPSGRRKFTATTRKEAVDRMNAAIAAQARGEPLVASVESFAAVAHDWLEARRSNLRPGGWRKHEERMRNHVIPAIGRVAAAKLTPERLDRLYTDKLEAGLAPQTVRHIHATVHACLEFAMKRGRVVRNVADLVEPPDVTPHEMTTFTEREYRSFLDAAKDDLDVGAFLVVDATTGMRKSELLGLRWKDVNLERGEIHLSTVLDRVDGEVTFAKPKTRGSRRHIQLTHDAVDALRRRRTQQLAQRLAAGPAWDNLDLVFTRENGEPLSETTLRRKFLAVLERSGLPKLRIHDLRHTVATVLMGRGVNPKIVSEMLGHSRISVTLDLYSHVTPNMQREAVSALEAAGGAR